MDQALVVPSDCAERIKSISYFEEEADHTGESKWNASFIHCILFMPLTSFAFLCNKLPLPKCIPATNDAVDLAQGLLFAG